MTFSDKVQPISLQPADTPVPEGTTAFVSGWGTTAVSLFFDYSSNNNAIIYWPNLKFRLVNQSPLINFVLLMYPSLPIKNAKKCTEMEK